MKIVNSLKHLFSRKHIASAEDVFAFLETRAAYLAQKSVSEYAQARANMMFSTLLGEKGFLAAFEASRWRSYPAALSMVAEVMAAALRLRLHVPADETSRFVEAVAARVISKMKGHGPMSAEEWEQAHEGVAADLARAALGAPHEAHMIARARAREVFETLPFHTAIKQHDFDMFSNTLAFHLTEIATELEEAKLSETVVKVSGNPLA